MALRFDGSKMKNPDLLWDENDEVRPTAHVIIFTMIPIKMGEITEDNWIEFYRRVNLWERLFGPMLIRDGKLALLTPKDIHDHIGLSANVITESKAKFMKLINENLEFDAKKECERYLNSLETVDG